MLIVVATLYFAQRRVYIVTAMSTSACMETFNIVSLMETKISFVLSESITSKPFDSAFSLVSAHER